MTVLPFRRAADVDAAFDAIRRHLDGGGLVAYPTETVYGFGSLLREHPSSRLADLKGRALDKPFLLLDAAPLRLPGVRWTPAATVLARAFWPGPLSLAVPADERYRPPVRSAAGTIAVRDTPHVPLRRLLQLLDEPLTSTSANLPGQPPATTLADLLATVARFPQGEDVLVLDGGELPASAPSTVVDCAGPRPRLLREGAVPINELRGVLQAEGFVIDVG